MEEGFVQPSAVIFQNACFHFNAPTGQTIDTFTTYQRVGVNSADYNPGYVMFDNAVDTGVGVFPSWQQGSSVTYSVAPFTALPAS